MDKKSKQFLFDLLETPSVSGFEQEIQKVIKKYISSSADKVEIDLHGNLIATLNPKAKRRVMLAGHCDQIGFMIKHIAKDGTAYVSAVGGIDYGVVPGARATIYTKKGPIPAIFGRKPIHHQSADERSRMSIGEKHCWLDFGASSDKEAKKLVQIGDQVTYELSYSELASNLICGPGLDDRVGCYVAIETLKQCAKKKLDVGLYSVSTVQEEVGLRGAISASYSVDPEIGMAIDVTFANDNPGKGPGNDAPIECGKGATISKGVNTNPVVEKKLIAAATSKKIPYQTELCASPRGNDTSAIQVTRGGKATASIGLPCRYMHTTGEVVSLDDLDNAVKLLTEFICKIKTKDSFVPK